MDGTRRVTLRQAAEELGVSVEAVRKRVKRGSLRADKAPDGRVYVFLDTVGDAYHPQPQDEASVLVETLRDEIGHLRRESERKDAIIMSLSQSNAELSRTIRQLEAPQEPPAGSETTAEEPERAEPRSSTGGPQAGPGRPRDTAEFPMRGGSLTRPWWRRVFGG
jgi:hypothetical protein